MEKINFKEAYTHLLETINAYKKHANGIFALNVVLYPLKKRYDNGERSIELYNSMIDVN